MKDKIFRIENLEKRGIYRGPDWDGVYDTVAGSKIHPSPHNDSKLLDENKDLFYSFDVDEWRFLADEFVFGFSSIDQLRRWLYNDAWLRSLDEKGYMLSIYEGDVRHGHTQAVIDKSTAELVEQHKISEFFNL